MPLRRETLDPRDLVRAYVAVIDCYAKALRAAVKLVADGAFSRNLQVRRVLKSYLGLCRHGHARPCGLGRAGRQRSWAGQPTAQGRSLLDPFLCPQQRYLSFHSGFGARLSSGEATLEDCEEHARKLQQQQQQQPGAQAEGHHEWGLVGGRPEQWEAVCARYIAAVTDSSRE